ncbi:hypothetical protein HPP92_013310 [Vanilla planifolia]|uniref:Pentatricopeptide repeat-containing protein n=1 Tax=Vanilla planifolia TaxID=51239 RepID=A0A835QWS8_VANPL|nr:hypothetical protein HPP92_013310 [Vanilla planifolia]
MQQHQCIEKNTDSYPGFVPLSKQLPRHPNHQPLQRLRKHRLRYSSIQPSSRSKCLPLQRHDQSLHTQNYHFPEAIALYKQMLRCAMFGDRFTYPFVLKSCAGLIHVRLGRQVHTQVIKCGLEFNSVTQNSLIEMYAKVDDLVNARKVFHDMSERDSVSWNTLISAHARLGQMRRAKALFDTMPSRTIVSWTALISGYTLEGRCSEAVAIFRRMQAEGFEPDDVSIVSVLPACVELGALELGRWIHTYAERHGLLQKMVICNALIEMHAKCGSIDDAIKLFDNMPQRDVISWSTMICGLAQHGRARKAVQLFETMKDENRVNPNSVTFLGLLAACAHGGLLDEGLHYFSLMKETYGITAGVEHYGCIVDLLGRAGCIARAVEVVGGMSIPADAAIWGSLLSASHKHGDIETAVRSMEELMRLEPEDMGNYVLLLNTYAAEKRWEDVARIRILMRSRRLNKTPGCSSIEVGDAVH